MIEVKCERYWKWIAKKKTRVNTGLFFTAYKNIKGDGRNFHVQTKGYMFVCEFVHAYYITRFDVR